MVARHADGMKILVIGAGPAGLATAISARNLGFDVTVLEQTPFPRHRPGETFHPGMEPLLASIGAASVLRKGNYLRHLGTWLDWGAKSEFRAFGSDKRGRWRGFQALRSDFDSRLAGTAKRLGCEFITAAAQSVISGAKGRVIGVRTTISEHSADIVVDASGSNHWLARVLDVPIIRRSVRLVARYGYVQGTIHSGLKLPRICADEYGWTWIANLSPGRYVWTRVTQPGHRPEPSWTPREFRAIAASTSKGADVTWRIAARTAGKGWFICGDAAAVLDPSCSHGVLRALMSGIMAMHSVAKSCRALGSMQDGANAYDQWQQAWFQYDEARMAAAYREVGLFGYGSAGDYKSVDVSR